MNKNRLLDFEKIEDYRKRVIAYGINQEVEKFDFNKKLKNNAFKKLLSKAATTHFPENDKNCSKNEQLAKRGN